MAFWNYQPAVLPCSGKSRSGTRHLQTAIMARFDHAIDFGIYNCRPLTTNAKIPSIHSDGRAGDTGFPVTNGKAHPEGFVLVALLRLHASELGIMGIIWNERRYDHRAPAGRIYTGPNPHIDHVHWEQEPNLARGLSLATAFELMGVDDMAFTSQEEMALKRVAPYASFLAELARLISIPGPTTQKRGTAESLLHVLETYRQFASDQNVDATNHRELARLLGQ